MELTAAQVDLLRQLAACRTWREAKRLSAQFEALCLPVEYSIGGIYADPEEALAGRCQGDYYEDTDDRPCRVTLPPELAAQLGLEGRPAPDRVAASPERDPVTAAEHRRYLGRYMG